jgi:hypothetical protein
MAARCSGGIWRTGVVAAEQILSRKTNSEVDFKHSVEITHYTKKTWSLYDRYKFLFVCPKITIDQF